MEAASIQRIRKSSKCDRRATFLSAYLITVLNSGVFNSFGTLFDDIKTTFSSTRAETAAIQSALAAIGLGAGLPIGVLVHTFGPVIVGLGGSVITALGLGASFFSTSVAHLIVCISIFYGIGFSCLFVSSTTVISQTFHGKKRLVMMSIHATGASVGGTLYPFCLRFLSAVSDLNKPVLSLCPENS